MKQEVTEPVVFRSQAPWRCRQAGIDLHGRGDPTRLSAPLTAFFASRTCPGAAIRNAMDWALQQAQVGQPVVGGFHSPLERSVLELLLEAGSPVVVVLARPVASARLGSHWQQAIGNGHLTVVSASEKRPMMTQSQAASRNEIAARLADAIVMAHASADGTLVRQATQWQKAGLQVQMLGNLGGY